MHNKFENTTIALAGLFQAVALVGELTQTGKISNEAALEASIYSIFQTNPADMAAVYNGTAGIKLGLEKIIKTFSAPYKIDALQGRHLLSLIRLQKKILRSPHIQNTLAQRITQGKKQVDYFSLTHPTVITNLADIYLNTISTFKLRIIILGSQRVLGARENMDKIRALLLAGIRSAVLWQQMGGSRLQFLFSRGKIKAAAEKLLTEIK